MEKPRQRLRAVSSTRTVNPRHSPVLTNVLYSGEALERGVRAPRSWSLLAKIRSRAMLDWPTLTPLTMR